ncbi:alanine--tRNA ligase [Mycoplasma sp. 'Moose RK']|uniref:alanine--tRNA ligase n=1 Tax=Mycoplasma sp. 'Moose RK' TaxID=2780095 RepID=UPI0018C28C77|nr:alanine--tRNA ligase [Mycoplasma sp. 'Moose RK']MBG0730598.1 alanine--tRNA ligase [Mycoplasma sp. 'Moose RK']
MKKLSSSEIRQLWVDFFVEKKHLFLESKSLVPQNDDSLLWINSGVATLKDYFTGKKVPPAKRLVNSQVALRTNDIENVGMTSRHHTLFEMLGNFSINDYFKNEAIEFAYEFLVQKLEMDPGKLFITFYKKDTETLKKWLELGIPRSQLIPGSRKTNFWDLGQGPCGPCTEIYFDRGPKFDQRNSELIEKEIENDRFIEIWNIVFSEVNNDGNQNYTNLIAKNIDTGAGLERITSILQSGPTNYDTDLFLPIIQEIEKFTDFRYKIDNYFVKNAKQGAINANFRIIADHIRAITFAINDQVLPSNSHRGYIIRRLIRRAYWNGKKLGISKPFLFKLPKIVAKTLKKSFSTDFISKIIKKEEEGFAKTLEIGHNLLEKELSKNKSFVDPKLVFKLFETYGFPFELTKEILAEKKIDFNLADLEELQKNHAEISRKKKFIGMAKTINSLNFILEKISDFVGYDQQKTTTKVVFLANENEKIDESNNDELSYVVFEKTPFYATSGGQKHDQGWIVQENQKIPVINVFKDKFFNNVHVFQGKLTNKKLVSLIVDSKNRVKLERNHSATHLLFAALRAEFGEQIKQLGSNNNENRLTFDFPCQQKPTFEQLQSVEKRINSYINQAVSREYLLTNLEEAQKLNAIMTLEESEYLDPNSVRLVRFSGITTDLCGGTHIENTKLIEKFTITGCQNKGAGIYRIRAVTSFEEYFAFVEENIAKINEQNFALIKKIKEIKPNFIFDFPVFSDKEAHLQFLQKKEDELKKYYLEVVKEKKESSDFRLEKNKILQIKNFQFYLDFEFSAQNLKKAAAVFREQNHELSFILLANLKNDNFLIAVSSTKLKSDFILDHILKNYGGTGGGNSKIALGKLSQKPLFEEINSLLWKINFEF